MLRLPVGFKEISLSEAIAAAREWSSKREICVVDKEDLELTMSSRGIVWANLPDPDPWSGKYRYKVSDPAALFMRSFSRGVPALIIEMYKSSPLILSGYRDDVYTAPDLVNLIWSVGRCFESGLIDMSLGDECWARFLIGHDKKVSSGLELRFSTIDPSVPVGMNFVVVFTKRNRKKFIPIPINQSPVVFNHKNRSGLEWGKFQLFVANLVSLIDVITVYVVSVTKDGTKLKNMSPQECENILGDKPFLPDAGICGIDLIELINNNWAYPAGFERFCEVSKEIGINFDVVG